MLMFGKFTNHSVAILNKNTILTFPVSKNKI